MLHALVYGVLAENLFAISPVKRVLPRAGQPVCHPVLVLYRIRMELGPVPLCPGPGIAGAILWTGSVGTPVAAPIGGPGPEGLARGKEIWVGLSPGLDIAGGGLFQGPKGPRGKRRDNAPGPREHQGGNRPGFPPPGGGPWDKTRGGDQMLAQGPPNVRGTAPFVGPHKGARPTCGEYCEKKGAGHF